MTDPDAAPDGDNTAPAGSNQADNDQPANAQAGSSQPAGAQPGSTTDAAQAQAVRAQEAADTRDRLLRALAEMENEMKTLRRRTEREVADARAYGVTGLARDLIGVADDLRRALDAADESQAIVEGPAKALCEGVELIERQLLKALEKHGIRMFDPQGMKFDPNVHQAMFEVPNADVPAGSVVQVIQPGFMIGERVLRPALVGVSKGGPKAAPAAEGTSTPTTGNGSDSDGH